MVRLVLDKVYSCLRTWPRLRFCFCQLLFHHPVRSGCNFWLLRGVPSEHGWNCTMAKARVGALALDCRVHTPSGSLDFGPNSPAGLKTRRPIVVENQSNVIYAHLGHYP
jgi:hypothetical protein